MIDEDDYIDEYCFVTSVYHHCAKKQYILEAYHFVVNHMSPITYHATDTEGTERPSSPYPQLSLCDGVCLIMVEGRLTCIVASSVCRRDASFIVFSNGVE